MIQNTLTSQARRQHRVRAKLLAGNTLPRLSVLRSNQHISAQIIDPKGQVLAAASILKKFKGSKMDEATEVGKLLGEKAKAANITNVIFDRGSYKFHGRVKALAEAVRESGIKF